MTVQIPVGAHHTDEGLSFIREMGVDNVNLNVTIEDSSFEKMEEAKERFSRFDITVGDIACLPLQKNAAINLGWPEKDAEIEKFNAFAVAAGKAGIPIISVAWQPNGILRTARKEGKYTRGGISAIADMSEIAKRPNANKGSYTIQDIWDNFAYFLKHTLPVCEKAGVRMALHPNDPPVSCLAGVPSLIYRTEDYRRAFKQANNSPALGMKLCVGCWLEGASDFGDILSDIEEFCAADKILCVHFRNVSAPLPYFEETLAEDGYADMFPIMQQLVRCGYKGLINADHTFAGYPSMGGSIGAFAYPTGYLKGLLHAAERTCGIDHHSITRNLE